ncbi:TldD/PmbA family protein, partial [Chloroflexota bacterium]
EAEVFRVSRSETEALFEANRLKQVQTHETSGTALRIVKEGRIGFSASNKANGDQELITMALEMAPFGTEAKFEFPCPDSYPDVEVYDPSMEAVSEEYMIGLGQSLIDKVRGNTLDLICEAGVSKSVTTIEIMNSRGGKATYQKSVFGIGIEGVLIRGTDMLFVGDSESSCSPVIDLGAVYSNTIEQLERAKRISPAPAGKLPIIFTPHGVASALVMPLVLAVNGKTVLQGASPLGNRKGERVFDPGLSIRDDATINLRPGSRICDDEGVPSQHTSLVENGVVAGFLYDLQSAAQAGTQSTGSASRGLGSLPVPAVGTLVIEDGDTDFEDMLADIKEGLIVEQLMGASQGNVLGGDFSGNVILGYKVENGEILGRVKDAMVSGNIYETLSEIEAVGRDGRWVNGILRIPHLYCPRVVVSAQG